VFISDALHEGEKLESGYKYIMRTFIMFRCVTKFDSQIEYAKDEAWLETLQLYASFDALHVKGDTREFTRAYLEAQAAQLRHRRTLHSPSGPFPIDIFRVIFSHMGARDVLRAMQLSRAWYESGRDNATWQRLYETEFGKLEPTVKGRAVEFDWFGKYKQKCEKCLRIFVIGDVATFANGITLH
jgi:hypothetical protein